MLLLSNFAARWQHPRSRRRNLCVADVGTTDRQRLGVIRGTACWQKRLRVSTRLGLPQLNSKYCRELANEWAEILRAPGLPRREMLGERFICIDVIVIQKCHCFPAARLPFKNRQQLDGDNSVTIAKLGVTAQRRVMLAKPIEKSLSGEELMLRKLDSLRGIGL